MQIPKQMSRPADPSRMSFLDRSGEIRNMIYEVLFKRDEPVLLHNADAYHAIEPKRKYYPDEESYYASMEEFESTYESEIGADHEFVHDFHLGLPLLLVCRQIYHEAASIFYGDNTFIFSRVLDRQDGGYQWHEDYRNAYHQLDYAPQWLFNIGNQFGMLKKVQIDFDAMCYRTCQQQTHLFDALPLLRLLWKNGSKKSPITFACTGRRLRADCDYYNKPTEKQKTQYAESTANGLNAIFSSLIGEGHLSLQKFAHFDRLITFAEMDLLEREITVRFGQDVRRPFNYWKDFGVASNGEVVVTAQNLEVRHLLDLPDHILSKIVNMAVVSPEGIRLDIESQTVYGLDLNLLQVNSTSRTMLGNMLSHTNNITLVSKSTEGTTSFGDFKFLSQWMESSAFQYLTRNWIASNTVLNIALDFEIVAVTTLRNLRINIKELMHAMRYYMEDNMAVSISLKYPRGGQYVQEESVKISLPSLSRKVFLLLSDVISSTASTRDQLPDIWMDGYGKLLNASYPASSTALAICIENRHAKLKVQEIEFRGYHFAGALTEKEPGADWDRQSQPLYQVWAMIREYYWTDWGDRRPRIG